MRPLQPEAVRCVCQQTSNSRTRQEGAKLTLLQVDICGPAQSQCVSSVPLETGDCLPQCRGLHVTSIARHTNSETTWNKKIRKLLEQYDHYRLGLEEPVRFSEELIGKGKH